MSEINSVTVFLFVVEILIAVCGFALLTVFNNMKDEMNGLKQKIKETCDKNELDFVRKEVYEAKHNNLISNISQVVVSVEKLEEKMDSNFDKLFTKVDKAAQVAAYLETKKGG